MSTSLPERINAMRLVYYDVKQLVTDMAEASQKDQSEITLDEVMGVIADYATEDLASSYMRIIYQDENGEEL